MRLKDLLRETVWSLAGNRARTALTMLGIIIGIGSVIALVSIGQGAQAQIEQSIQSIGSNLIIVIPGSREREMMDSSRGTAQTLTQADADAIKKEIAGVAGVAPDSTQRFQVIAGGNNTNTSVIATVADYTTVRNVSMASGTFISVEDNRSLTKVAVLGPTTQTDLFGENANAIGKFIRISGVNFKVIGVTLAKGGSGFANPDDSIYVPLSTAQRYLIGSSNVTTISIAASDEEIIPNVQKEIISLLKKRHAIKSSESADFTVLNQTDIASAASSITSTFTALLASIAGISLLVGGIGIMNMMLTTVTERTREIGLRKAIGANKKDISFQFLAEAITLTFMGGAIGIIFGLLLSLLVMRLIGLTAQISLSAIFLAFGVSTGIGIMFGYYPARRAASLNPIEALRYE